LTKMARGYGKSIMHLRFCAPILSFILFFVGICAPARAHDEVVAAHNAAGQLVAHLDFTQPYALPPSPFPGINGYALAEPGYSSLVADEPAEDLFTLLPASSIRFVLLAKDPGIEVWNDTGSGFMPIGGTFFLGPPFFDSHPVWNIVSGSPGTNYALTM